MKELKNFLTDILEVLLLLVGVAFCICILTDFAYQAMRFIAR